VHLMEMSPFPEQALPVADQLRSLVPDAGHLVHMPTHIDVLCGDYKSTLEWNLRAIEVNEKYVAREGRVGFYALYHAHDRHFAIYGAMFLGRSQVALRVAADLEASLPEELLRIEQPPMADYLEAFIPMRLHVLIRFGLWEEILALPLPTDPTLYCTTTAMTQYAQGVAYAATGRMEEAQAARNAFVAAVGRVPESRYLFNNTSQDILAVAGAMLDGELEYRRGQFDVAFEHLRQAIALDDALPYDEPWGWMQPTRHAYGALLLEQGRVEEAEAIYAEDLGYDPSIPRSSWHPGNVWSLHGYHECLVRLGKDEAARIIKQQLDVALARADVPIVSSCFCRRTHHEAVA
jgi:tetratricopeptide (TPR) repeat protein